MERVNTELTAAAAAARLGVKKATLYAYVSRGLIHRNTAMDGRTSLFDAEEIDAFRSRRRRQSDGELAAVISTAITLVAESGVLIRGRDLAAMVDNDRFGFEQAAEWLWTGEDPEPEVSWLLDPEVAAAVERVASVMPAEAPIIERIRVAVATMSATDPMRYDATAAGIHTAARTLVLGMVQGLPSVGQVADGGGVAAQLWPRLTAQEATVERIGALDAAMALTVDHGLAASTFGARVAASTRADPYSIVAAALGVFGGPLHGRASAEVHRLLVAAEQVGDAAIAIGDAQRRSGYVPGFGHTIYREEDPRYAPLMRKVSSAYRDDPRLAQVRAVRDVTARRDGAAPNIDLALGSLMYLAEAASESGEAVFAIARTAGWIAHGIEELGEKALRFRPRARYIGSRP